MKNCLINGSDRNQRMRSHRGSPRKTMRSGATELAPELG